jgi:type IV pilus assembly protein PilB
MPTDLIELEREADDELVRRLAQRLGYTFVRDLSAFPVDPAAWDLVPPRVIKRFQVVPIGFEGETLVVATADPTNVIGLDDVRTASGRELKVLVARTAEVEEVIARAGALDRSAEMSLAEAAAADEAEADQELDFDAPDAPIVKAINQIITRAVHQRASDVHIEPRERDVRIRFRIDGVLTDAMQTRASLSAGLNSRLKVMANLDIAEKRLPQDGRLSAVVGGRSVDLRLATLPTAWGEKIVLRILDTSKGVHKLADLGFDEPTLALYREVVSRPHGAILLTGPTGSGKTSTLYATLDEINSPVRNIVTVEDPVEMQIPGLTQMQVNRKAGLTFATALRSILRADPDVIMIGEMRDHETAKIAIEAALTGHLVFATLHTSDAASAMTRLIDIGVEPLLVASAVECIVAQRLARRLCERCAESYTPAPDVLARNGIPHEPGSQVPQLWRAVGCNACAETGYRGRLAIIEVLRVSPEIRRITGEGHRPSEIREQARAEGMRTLHEDAMEKALMGATSIEEALRVVG